MPTGWPNPYTAPTVPGEGLAAGRMPPATLPGFVAAHPDHLPSTVTIVRPVATPPGHPTAWVQTTRTECGCRRWAHGRTRPATAPTGLTRTTAAVTCTPPPGGPDDVALRSAHADHTSTVRT